MTLLSYKPEAHDAFLAENWGLGVKTEPRKQKHRIGFCCKWLQDNGQIEKPLNNRTTTIKWLRNHPKEIDQKLMGIAAWNMEALYALVERVSQQPQQKHMVRLTSDVLPAYDHPEFAWWWQQAAVQNVLKQGFSRIGELARAKDIRLSFHPGQFCVLASDKPRIVENSIKEFEYHVDMARLMGYGKQFQDFKINVHISGALGPKGIKAVLPYLSPEARNVITIENAEYSHGLEASLELADDLALVLDIHHHWIATGEYIQPHDPRLDVLRGSWRGVRPVLHYSVSRECEVDSPGPWLPNLAYQLERGKKTGKLRAHSDYYWNESANKWAATFIENWDIQLESKMKNLAQDRFCEFINSRGLYS